MRACFGWEFRNKPVFFIIPLVLTVTLNQVLNLIQDLTISGSPTQEILNQVQNDMQNKSVYKL